MQTCSACGGLTPLESIDKDSLQDSAGASLESSCLHCDAPLRAPRWARKLSALLGPAGAILLAACYGGPGRYRTDTSPIPGSPEAGPMYEDADQDRAPSPYFCPGEHPACLEKLGSAPKLTDEDCDDKNPAIHPGAEDPDGDGIDQNCDGVDGWADPAKAAAPAPAP
jgi:hypothetical protein